MNTLRGEGKVIYGRRKLLLIIILDPPLTIQAAQGKKDMLGYVT